MGARSANTASLSMRLETAKADPRFFHDSVTLPQPSMAAAFAAAAHESSAAAAHHLATVEMSPPPSGRLAISPGVRITEGGKIVRLKGDEGEEEEEGKGGEGGIGGGPSLDSLGSMYSSASALEREKAESSIFGAKHSSSSSSSKGGKKGGQKEGRVGKKPSSLLPVPEPVLDGKMFQLALQIERSKSGLLPISSRDAQPGRLSPSFFAPGSPESSNAVVQASYDVVLSKGGVEQTFLQGAKNEAFMLKQIKGKPFAK